MALIRVPRPAKSAYDPQRPVSSLLRTQIEHLRDAESKLPLKYRSEIYVRAIKTEGEAARYIREVTEAIHEAHAEAERARRVPKRKKTIEIAAVADDRGQRARKTRSKKISKKKGRRS